MTPLYDVLSFLWPSPSGWKKINDPPLDSSGTPPFYKMNALLHGGGWPQVDEVTRSGDVKLHAILQPRHPGVQILKIIEWSLST